MMSRFQVCCFRTSITRSRPRSLSLSFSPPLSLTYTHTHTHRAAYSAFPLLSLLTCRDHGPLSPQSNSRLNVSRSTLQTASKAPYHIMPLPSDFAVNQSDFITPALPDGSSGTLPDFRFLALPFRTPTNKNAFLRMGPQSAIQAPPLPDDRLAAVQMASFELQKVIFSTNQSDHNNHTNKKKKRLCLDRCLGPCTLDYRQYTWRL